MKKIVALALFVMLILSVSLASAALTDNKASIARLYGEYRMVTDTDNQLWDRAEWESVGYKKTKAGGYMHYFDRAGMAIQTEVNYDGDKPDSYVKAQRFTPVGIFRIKDLKTYLPEIYDLVTSPKAEVFTTNDQVTRQFREDRSPLTIGVLVRQPLAQNKALYTLVAFNVKDEGRLLKDAKFVTRDLYIQEIAIQRFYRVDLEDQTGTVMNWDWMKTNIFK